MQSAKPAGSDRMIENRTFDEIAVGDSASLSRTVTQQDIELFAIISGDVNLAHMDQAYADADMFHKIIAQGMLEAGLISAVLGTKLPGPGTIYLGQDLRFLHPVSIGDRITATLTVTEKHPEKRDLVLDCRCTNQDGELVISGTAYVRAPAEKVRRPRVELPEVQLSRHARFRALLAAHGRARTAGHGGRPSLRRQCAGRGGRGGSGRSHHPDPGRPEGEDPQGGRGGEGRHCGISAGRCPAQRSGGGRGRGAGQTRRGRASDEGLAAYRRIDARRPAAGHRPADRTMAQPCLSDGRAELSATAADDRRSGEYRARSRTEARHRAERHRSGPCDGDREAARGAAVGHRDRQPELHSTLDAAALCKMADRGQITGGLVDGPLAFDNAVSPAAAAEKGIVSKVAGKADISWSRTWRREISWPSNSSFCGADAAGVVLGARAPIF